jgi:hypothetical protein
MKVMKRAKKGGEKGREMNENASDLPKTQGTRISVWKEAIEKEKTTLDR